jgi:hypothetical protein
MKSTYELILKYGAKVLIENFEGTKSIRKNLEGLKTKLQIFIGQKHIYSFTIL